MSNISNIVAVTPITTSVWSSVPRPTNPAVGSIGYDSVTNQFQIFDGNTWIPIWFSGGVGYLGNDQQEVLNWAKKRMEEERELDELCKQHPGLEDARRQYEMMKALVKEHHYE